MTSRQKAKGSAYERAVVLYLREQGWTGAERTRAGWQEDRGDIDGVPGVTWECKNQQRMTLSEWVDELVVEMQHGNNDIGAVIHKRSGRTDVGDHYATMPVRVLVRLLKEAGY